MKDLPKWVLKVTTIWVAIGSLLMVTGSQGVTLPDFLPKLFSQELVDAVLQVIGAVITFVQFVRTMFVTNKLESDVQVLSVSDKRKFILNPFKLI